MSGLHIRRTMRTGSHEVRQNSTAALEETPELAIAAEPEPFQMIANTTQSDAAALLQRLADRRPSARRGYRLPAKPSPKAPRGTGTVIVMGVFVVCALLLAAWLSI